MVWSYLLSTFKKEPQAYVPFQTKALILKQLLVFDSEDGHFTNTCEVPFFALFYLPFGGHV